MTEHNQTPQPKAEKTFTQEEVNRIVSERLNEYRQKHAQPAANELSEREALLTKREFGLQARTMLKNKGHSERLIEVLDAPDAESLGRCIDVIESIYGSPQSPAPIFSAPASGLPATKADPIRDAMGLPKL